jgi:glycine cleavage system H protein
VYVEIETEGDSLAAEAVFGTVEAVKTVSDLFMPIGGDITEFNAALEDTPEAVNEDPYNTGWMIKLKMEDPGQLNDLLSPDQYKELIQA